MTPDDLLRELQSLLEETPPKEALAAFQGFKRARPKEDHPLLDAGFDLFIAGGLIIPKAQRLIVVALVHGIRTTGAWQEKARASLQIPGKVKVVPIGYGYLDALRFLGPFRGGPIAKVEQELRDLHRLNENSDLVVMAHSFGTYIISRILRQSPDIRITRLLLCGSIIPAGYRWDQISNQIDGKNCINEVGTKDAWPVFAQVASLGYGCSGSFGFKTARVLDRFFDYGHSDFFTDEHLKKYWRPFILTGEFIESPWDKARPTSPWTLSILSGVAYLFRGILLSLLVMILVGLYFLGKLLFT